MVAEDTEPPQAVSDLGLQTFRFLHSWSRASHLRLLEDCIHQLRQAVKPAADVSRKMQAYHASVLAAQGLQVAESLGLLQHRERVRFAGDRQVARIVTRDLNEQAVV